ncbi:alpha-glucosidase/alpha-galactosidase [Spirochaetia bacterium]|nr:alpha-glucosidase/alpha-galactosidase [Spirochaetia bacterium]GHU34824.1 alpha-glucosidase/alpha-galactosidase [Spirochaetia bacterium]
MDLKICYIGGGSRNWAWVLLQDLCFEKDIRGTVSLYDIDNKSAQDNEIIGNTLMQKHNPGQWTFKAEPSLEKALTGSNFVFISILPGDFEEMAVDVHTPEKYGIYQSVGDTVGPGGIIRALRTIPQFQVIAQAIKKWAPRAWVINYTNPMTICTRILYKEFPEIKAFGCCHEVFNTQKLLVTVLEESKKIPSGTVQREDISTQVVGINHFTWINKASYKNIDLFPLYADFVEHYHETGFEKRGKTAEGITSFGSGDHFDWKTDYFASADRVKMDLFKRYGLIAAAGDRHLAEFCPHSWYLKDPEQVKSWKFSLTPVSWRISNREMLREKSKAYREGTEMLNPTQSGEEGITILKALLGLGNIVTNVNLPNRGQMPDLPADVVIETNAFFSKNSIQPLVSPELPVDINALVIPHVLSQEGIVEATMERDIEKAFRVFSHDLSIQTLSLSDARNLFNEMTQKTLKISWNNR